MKQILYDINSGLVLQWQNTDMFGYADPQEGYAILAVTDSEWDNQEGVWYVNNNVLTQTNPNPPTAEQLLQQAQIVQISILNTSYLNSIQNCTVSINSVNYAIDLSQVNLLLNQLSAFTAQQAVTANTTTFNRYIKLTNGTYASFTAAQVVHAITQIENYLHNQKETLIGLLNNVNSATTPEAVQAIVWG